MEEFLADVEYPYLYNKSMRTAESALIVAVTGRRSVRFLTNPENFRPASYMIFQDLRMSLMVHWLDFMEPDNNYNFTGLGL